MQNHTLPSAYYPYIDGLRAIAVLAVIIYHLHARWLPGGFSGVDLFFVISGFVVSLSHARFHWRHFSDFVITFYARRMKRILPALLVCLLLTQLASTLFIPQAWLSDTNEKTGRFALFGLSNFILVDTNNDYFSPRVEFNPYTHTWSLAVEEQFYILFPFLFFAWAAFRKYHPVSLLLFAAGLVASLVHARLLASSNSAMAFYMVSSRFWELAAGVMLYQVMALRAPVFGNALRPPTTASSTGLWLSAGLIATGLITSDPTRFPFPGALLPVLGLLGMLWFGQGRMAVHPVLRLLTCRPMVFVGRISYSLYLWHWPVFVLFRWTCGLGTPLTQTIAVASTFAISTLSWRFVETPVRRTGLFQRLPHVAVVTLGLAAVGAGWLGYQRMTDAQPRLSLSQVSHHAADWYPVGQDTSLNHPGCQVDTRAEDVQGSTLFVYSRSGCGEHHDIRRLFVIGDSHAMAYVPLLKQTVLETGSEVYLYNNGGCPFLSFQPWREDARCLKFSTASLNDVQARIRADDVLFMPSLRLPRLADQFAHFGPEKSWNEMFGKQAVSGRRSAGELAQTTLAPLARQGAWLMFEAPKPVYDIPPFRCADWFNRGNPACAYSDRKDKTWLQQLRQPVLDTQVGLSLGNPRIVIWDPFPLLCPGTSCSPFHGDRSLYFDGDHLSGYGNRLLQPSFRQFLTRLNGPAVQ